MSSSLSALKTRLFCPHRSVQLRSLHSLLALLNDDPTSDDLCNLLWSCITSPNYVLSSSALSGLALLVMSGKYRAEVTIDRLLTSALDLNTEQKLQDFVICVGKMLESQSRTSSKPADCLWGVEKNPHPFITITQRFPASWTVILNFFCEEMITNTSDGHSLRSLQMMAPFLRYTFCEPNIAAKSLPSSPQPKYFSRLLLSFLEVLIDAASDNSELFSYILKFAMSISLDLAMPIDGEFDSDKAIIFERVMNFVADFSAFDGDSKLACELSEDYASMLLSRLCELKAFNKDLTSFLRLLGDFHHQMSFPHIFSVLSYLLIDIPNPTAESSYYILRMMDVLLAGDETIIMSFWPIAELAVLPLTQILAEATSNRLLSAAASILTRLQSLRQRFLQQNLLAETRIPSPSGNSRLYNGVLGDILHRVSLLLQQYTNTEVSPEVPCDASNLLFLSPFIFHPSQTVQNLTFDSLCHIGNSLIKSHGLSLLFLIQYHLRSLNNPVCCLSVVPHLTSTYDPVITSKVLTTFTPMIHRKSVLSSYAVKLVVDVWNKNSRVYFQLKEIIGLYLKDARSVHNRRKDAPKYEVDTEIAVASAIRSILKTKSAENIQDMIPLIHSFLQLDNLHEVTISILLDSINQAIKSLTIDIRAGELDNYS
ncbi:hypothetical protein BKA69DRAFT_1047494 [Paraphysoderma sedebokerense]|nr:hypothetical protein BKA69DRAFT_1047494 [Paraphysoderma sedebokerense]